LTQTTTNRQRSIRVEQDNAVAEAIAEQAGIVDQLRRQTEESIALLEAQKADLISTIGDTITADVSGIQSRIDAARARLQGLTRDAANLRRSIDGATIAQSIVNSIASAFRLIPDGIARAARAAGNIDIPISPDLERARNVANQLRASVALGGAEIAVALRGRETRGQERLVNAAERTAAASEATAEGIREATTIS
jgi:hypothetical protein